MPTIYVLAITGSFEDLNRLQLFPKAFSEDPEPFEKRESDSLFRYEFETYEQNSVEAIKQFSTKFPAVRFSCTAFDRDDVVGASYWIQNGKVHNVEEITWRCGRCGYLHRESAEDLYFEDSGEFFYRCPQCGDEG